MKLYKHLLVSLKGRKDFNMKRILQVQPIVCFFLMTLFLISGCAGLGLNIGQIKKSKSGIAQQDIGKTAAKDGTKTLQTESEKPQLNESGKEVYQKVVSGSEPSMTTSGSDKTKLKEETSLKKKTNERFERAKKEINAYRKPAGKKKKQSGNIAFNFDNADLYEVIRTMAELLNISYIIDANITGKVTIHTTGQLNKSDLFPLFHKILELNGLAALEEGSLYRIISQEKISNIPIFARYGRDHKDIPIDERIVMQIVPLDFVTPKAITPMVMPFLSNAGKIISSPDSSLIIVIEQRSNLKRVLQLVDIFDVDLFDNIEHRFFKLEHIESSEMVDLINGLMAPYLKIDQTELNVRSIDRLNTVVAIADNKRVIKKVAEFITKIDAEENSVVPRIFIYKVKNSDAEDIASLLNKVFKNEEEKTKAEKSDATTKKQDYKQDKSEPKLFTQPKTTQKSVNKSAQIETSAPTGIGGGSSLSREIKIIPDSIRNALIIEAIPSDYLIVKRILKELDVMPRQVLIDVVILDVNITDTQTLGVEWSFLKDREGGDTGLLEASFGSETKGLTFSAGLTDDWIAAVKALAVDDRADVLSAPSVLASDNKSATINVVTQIPVTTSSYDSDNGVTTTTVQYRDTGIILTVTPQINDDGMVSMDIRQEVSSVVDSSADADNPSFFNRNVQTTLSVQNNQTIVIGGLISRTKGDNASGVPGLSSLPVIGFLFGEKRDSVIKNELIIMITPRVIDGLSDIDAVSREFKSKFSDLKTEETSSLQSDQ